MPLGLVTREVLAPCAGDEDLYLKKNFQRQAYKMISLKNWSCLFSLSAIIPTLRQKVITWKQIDNHFLVGLEARMPHKLQAGLQYIGKVLLPFVWSV